jgi:hypothetical protein
MFHLLMETGDALLQEDGTFILLNIAGATTKNALVVLQAVNRAAVW